MSAAEWRNLWKFPPDAFSIRRLSKILCRSTGRSAARWAIPTPLATCHPNLKKTGHSGALKYARAIHTFASRDLAPDIMPSRNSGGKFRGQTPNSSNSQFSVVPGISPPEEGKVEQLSVRLAIAG